MPGVGDISYLGQRDYSIRVWLDPGKMSSRQLSVTDLITAIQQQNVQVAAGQIGQPPVPTGQEFQYTMSTLGRLVDPEQFRNMILKTNAEGSIVRLRDIGYSELGAQSYDQTCTMDGKPSVALSIYQLPGSNALKVANLVRAKMEALKERFPDQVDYAIVYDTTPFIRESILEVFKTLRDAIILVAVVVLLFLQNWRSTLIPLVAVPVAIIGTFAVMAAIGFTLNNLTLFGLVLAIGIVVDDAIVVVEAVEHHIEEGMPPREATILAMDQVSGPVVAVGLVLSAVFVPCAFISGIIGQFFRQFALTIAVSTLISALNSLTLSPALSALLLKPRAKGSYEKMPRFFFILVGAWPGYLIGSGWLSEQFMEHFGDLCKGTPEAEYIPSILGILMGTLGGWLFGTPINLLMKKSFGLFNLAFDLVTRMYTSMVGLLLRLSVIVLLLYGGLLVLTWWTFTTTPTGFIPSQDKGYLLVNVQLPDGASAQRTRQGAARHREDRPGNAGGPSHRGHFRTVDPAQRQRRQLRRHLRHAEGISRTARSRAVRPGPGGSLAAGSPGQRGRRHHQRLRGAAGRGPGHGGRIQDHDRGSRRKGADRAAKDHRTDRRQRQWHPGQIVRGQRCRRDREVRAVRPSRQARPLTVSATARDVHQLPRQHALAIHRHRSPAGPDHERGHGGGIQFIAGVSRLALHQRL